MNCGRSKALRPAGDRTMETTVAELATLIVFTLTNKLKFHSNACQHSH